MGKEILDILKEQESFRDRNIQLPGGIDFSMESDRVTLTMLDPACCGLTADGQEAANMQSDDAAFEGWASILYTHVLHGKGEIYFSVPEAFIPRIQHEPLTGNGHFGRFLYRSMRFAEQYPWFIMEPPVKEAVDRFRDYFSQNKFVNNFPNQEAGIKQNSLEASVEASFADERKSAPLLRSLLGIANTDVPIYRQLPVGLFLDEIHTPFTVFTGGSSAIDLWTINGDTIYPIELKANNAMVGSITEIFFYSNYLYDVFVAPTSNFKRPKGKDFRGYFELTRKATDLRRVVGVLLLDKASLHPLLTEDVLKTLSQPKGRAITYRLAQYKIQPTLLPG